MIRSLTALCSAAALGAAGCGSGCQTAQSSVISGGEQQVVVEVVDGVPSPIDVHGGFYEVPKAAWNLYADDGGAATVRVDGTGALTIQRPGGPSTRLDGPIRCE